MTYGSNTFTSAYATCSCAVQQEFCPNFQSRERQDFSEQQCFTGADAAALHSASPIECARAFCLRDAENSGHPPTSIFQSRLTFPVLDLHSPVNARPDSQECSMRVVVCCRLHKYNSRRLGSCQVSSESFQSCP